MTERRDTSHLEQAIEAHLLEVEDLPPGHMIGDWMIITQVEPIDPGADSTPYHLTFKGGTLAPHRALGLLGVASEILDTPWDPDDD